MNVLNLEQNQFQIIECGHEQLLLERVRCCEYMRTAPSTMVYLICVLSKEVTVKC